MWKKSPRSGKEKLISFLWKCDLISCARNFHIFVRCVFHDDHVPYTYVLTTFWRICYFPNCWPKKLRNRDFPFEFRAFSTPHSTPVRACHKWNYYHVLKRLRHGENEKPCTHTDSAKEHNNQAHNNNIWILENYAIEDEIRESCLVAFSHNLVVCVRFSNFLCSTLHNSLKPHIFVVNEDFPAFFHLLFVCTFLNWGNQTYMSLLERRAKY